MAERRKVEGRTAAADVVRQPTEQLGAHELRQAVGGLQDAREARPGAEVARVGGEHRYHEADRRHVELSGGVESGRGRGRW